MQKASVKTVSIIDTLSELVQDVGSGPHLVDSTTTAVASPPNSSVPTSSAVLNKNNNNAPYYHYPLNPPPIPPIRGRQPPPPPGRSPKVVNIVPSPKARTSSVGRPLATSSGSNLLLGGEQHSTTSPDISAIQSPPQQQQMTKSVNSAIVLSPEKRKSGGGGAINERGGQTPDWIREIFTHAKRGALDRLNSSLDGLEPTLIRNLTDHHGNNLLHTVCSFGHSNMLPFMTRRFGHEVEGAMNDENKKGLTPPICAVKLGRLECLQWLVRNSSLLFGKGRTMKNLTWISRDGETRQRSLLHVAAKYGQDEICNWLCDEISQGGDVCGDLNDHLDMAGNSPLHLAAREGKISTVSVLLHHGAKIDAKNDMGLKSYDCARLANKKDCAEHLLLFETSMGVSRELIQVQTQKETLQAENNELRGYFKDVLGISKRLAKERDEMCRELGRLYDSMMELHNNMTMEIQVLSQENISLKRSNGSKEEVGSAAEIRENSNIDACTALHERWQQHQRQWFSGSLADSEHRLMLAEEGWKKRAGLTKTGNQEVDLNYTHRHIRDRIEELRSHSKQLASLNLPSSSDDDDDDISETDLDEDEQVREMRKLRRNIAQRKKLATPSPPNKTTTTRNNSNEDESVYSSLSNDMYSKIGSPTGSISNGKSSSRGKIVSSSSRTSPVANKLDKRKRSREELKQKLKEFSLTSETGTASVIEVIEPTSSEEEEFRRSMREMNLSWAKGVLLLQQNNSHQEKGHQGIARDNDEAAKRKFSNGELSPTKKLMEMGFALAEDEKEERRTMMSSKMTTTEHQAESKSLESKNNNKGSFFQKIAKWKTKRGVVRKEPAGRESDEPDADDINAAMAEEHVLPDSFEDSSADQKAADEDENERVKTVAVPAPRRTANSSLSPPSRKSLYGSGGKGSVTTSDDSGISAGPFPRPTSRTSGGGDLLSDNHNIGLKNNTTVIPINHNNNLVNLSKIEEVSVSSTSRCSSSTTTTLQDHQHVTSSPINNNSDSAFMNHHQHRSVGGLNNTSSSLAITPTKLLRKKSLESKAWYDVPSEDEREMIDEADSLASIISTGRASSSSSESPSDEEEQEN